MAMLVITYNYTTLHKPLPTLTVVSYSCITNVSFLMVIYNYYDTRLHKPLTKTPLMVKMMVMKYGSADPWEPFPAL